MSQEEINTNENESTTEPTEPTETAPEGTTPEITVTTTPEVETVAPISTPVSEPTTEPEQTTETTLETPATAETPSAVPGFEPKIIGFLCNWCCYAGADLCGVSRYQYPPNIRNIRVMCSTRIDPYLIISIFKSGADGIFIGGCHIGDCHYISGNLHTENKITLAKRLLAEAGFDPERLHLEWVSASEGERFSHVITDFTQKIKDLGPSPLRAPEPDQALLANMDVAEDAAVEFRLRALVGKEYKITNEGNVYGDLKTKEEWDDMFNLAITNEYSRRKIINLTGKQPYSVLELSKELDQPSDKVLEHIVYLRKNNFVAMDRIDGTTPKYVSLVEEAKQ